MVEDAAGAGEIGEEFFLGAEFRGMGEERAAGPADGMLDGEQFVVKDVFDGNLDQPRHLTATRFLRQSRQIVGNKVSSSDVFRLGFL